MGWEKGPSLLLGLAWNPTIPHSGKLLQGTLDKHAFCSVPSSFSPEQRQLPSCVFPKKSPARGLLHGVTLQYVLAPSNQVTIPFRAVTLKLNSSWSCVELLCRVTASVGESLAPHLCLFSSSLGTGTQRFQMDGQRLGWQKDWRENVTEQSDYQQTFVKSLWKKETSMSYIILAFIANHHRLGGL